jgi:diaminohydroxyphosphoribosylaminopyrimidine deaminase / 5-amino-6-(5-phosphoribosylamino)uracil reductase
MEEGRCLLKVARLFTDVYAHVADPYLRRALDLAERGRGTTSPNPLVGCVIVRDGEIVGEGFHERAGGAHAEIEALNAAGERARGATAYVTLEPCNHHGRTAPCSLALLDAGISHVVAGMPDPNPFVPGRGADALKDAGLQVEFAPDPTPFEELNVAWLTSLREHRPRVRAKMALTLDGRPTLGERIHSRLTGDAASKITMLMRAESDAILVGAPTVAIDDPALTVRLEDGTPAPRQPRRVVLTRTTPPPAEASIFSDGEGAVTVLVPEEADGEVALLPPNAEVVTYEIAQGLAGALRTLGDLGIVDLLVEPGPHLLSALWDEDLVDELVLYHAGGMGGEQAPSAFVGESPTDTARLSARFYALEAGVAGDDAVTVWRRREDV